MKEYRVQPEFINQIIFKRLLYGFRIFGLAFLIGIPYLYYFHPRREPYTSWGEFFADSSTQFTGLLFLGAVTLGVALGIITGKKQLKHLAVCVHEDFIEWFEGSRNSKKILFSDMSISSGYQDLVVTSKADKKLRLLIPRQIDDFTELEQLIRKSLG